MNSILKPIERIITKGLVVALDKPLKPPLSHEIALAQQLRQEFQNIEKIESAAFSSSQYQWAKNINRLHDLVQQDNPHRFLRWDVVQYTMFVGHADFVRKELSFLKNHRDWNSRWKEAIRESSIGHPLPYPFCPYSSGNLIHHAYHVAQFENKTGTSINEMDTVFEFGGGYGSMCRLFYNLGFRGRYIIYDLPPFSALQRFYLQSIDLKVAQARDDSFGVAAVNCLSQIDDLKEILMTQELGSNRMFLATWSLSETPLLIREQIVPVLQAYNPSFFCIAYQDQFAEMNNREWFEQWRKTTGNHIFWQDWEIRHCPGNFYLIGIREKYRKTT